MPDTAAMKSAASPSDRPQSIADLPAQRQASPASEAQARARYFNTGNAFNVILPPVPDHAFAAEPAKALDPATPTGLIPCDISAVLGCASPATTPLVLAQYGRIRAGETLTAEHRASGVVIYVIAGQGRTECGGETIEWGPRDLMVLPGGTAHRHTAASEDAVLWLVDNEPQVVFERLRPPAAGDAPTRVVHYPAAEIDRQIELIDEVGRDAAMAGSALIFSSEENQDSRNALPTLTVAMNSLHPGTAQRPHRHNSVAVGLIIDGEDCYSMVDGRRKDWTPFATTITPPVAVHSHHNEGGKRALFLIIQDGGIYYHARAMGFEFVDD